MRKFSRNVALLAIAGLAACASQPPERPAPRVAQPYFSEGDIPPLVELMRLEDTRNFDTAAFNRLATSQSALVRARTMLAAGRIGNRAVAPMLINGLIDSSDSVRVYAAFALGELADSSAPLAQALGTLSAQNDAAAAEAIAALGKIGGSAARPFVETALRTRKPGPELKEALLAIWRFPRLPLTSALVRPHTASPDPEVRWRAVYALTRGGPDPANVPAFVQWLRDPSPLVRSFATRGLRAATVDSAAQRAAGAAALAGALSDLDAHVRINAVSVLATYRDSALAARVTPLLKDADLNARIAAAQALGALKGSTAAAALDACAADASERPALRGAALVALMLAAPEQGRARAAEFARDGDALLRLYAARALAAGGTTSFQALQTLAADADPRVQAQAVASAAAIAADTLRSARAFFIEKLAVASPFVRAAALGALERLAVVGDEAIASEAFEFALRDSVDEAAGAALRVLARLAENNPAIRHSFATRFPLSRIPLIEVKRAAVRELKLEGICCTLPERPTVYTRVVNELLAPALRSGRLPRVRVNTAAGSFELELVAADAPLTVDNFLTLAGRKYYDGSRWHRVVPNFVLQDGDPTGTGSGGPGYSIRDEINRVRYLQGALGMALSGPDTGGSQFFVTHSPQPHLDGGYTVFGRVVSGMEVAERVIQDDPIVSIEVIQ